MPICAVCGEEVGTRYVHSSNSDLVYCTAHSHLSSSDYAKVCLQCGQKVSSSNFVGDSCPRCGTNFEAARRVRDEAIRANIPANLAGIKKIVLLHFIFLDVLTCIVVGSLFFLVIHFLGKLITPIGAALVLVVIVVVPLLYTITHPDAENVLAKFAYVGIMLNILSFFGYHRIESTITGRFHDSAWGEGIETEMNLNSIRSIELSAVFTFSLLIIATLLVELFLPGYFHSLLIAAATAIPACIIDTFLFNGLILKGIS